MNIRLSKPQKAQIFKNHEMAQARCVGGILMKPVFAVFTPPVSHLLYGMGPDEHLRPDEMLIGYSANRARPSEVMCLLQQFDSFCFLGLWDLKMYAARARELGKTTEVLDLADDSVNLDTTYRVLELENGSRLESTHNQGGCMFELTLKLSFEADDAALRPSLQLSRIEEPR